MWSIDTMRIASLVVSHNERNRSSLARSRASMRAPCTATLRATMPPSTVSSTAIADHHPREQARVLRVASPSVAEKRTSSGVSRASRSSMRCSNGSRTAAGAPDRTALAQLVGGGAELLDQTVGLGPDANRGVHEADAAKPAEQPDHPVDVVLDGCHRRQNRGAPLHGRAKVFPAPRVPRGRRAAPRSPAGSPARRPRRRSARSAPGAAPPASGLWSTGFRHRHRRARPTARP